MGTCNEYGVVKREEMVDITVTLATDIVFWFIIPTNEQKFLHHSLSTRGCFY